MNPAGEKERVIFLDNASTVFPKPHQVLDGMLELYKRYGVNPGVAGYDLCLVGGELVQTTREQLTRFFGGDHPDRLVFAHNATEALNTLIQGMVEPGDHVVTTVGEHNSVLRPLNHLRRDHDVEVDCIPYEADGRVDPDRIAAAFRDRTTLVVVNHGSNVIGTVQPLAEIGRRCREHGVRFITDTAQTAGVIPIDMRAMNIDALAFTGHKSMLGPTGIGGACVREDVTIRPSRFGGTGVRSADPFQPEAYPYRLEAGTGNILGVVGLHLAQAYIAERGLDGIHRHEMELFARLQAGLEEIEGVTLHGTTSLEHRLPVASLSVEDRDPAEVGTLLDQRFHIAVRTGLHCAPLIHEQLGTVPRGAVRLSLGPMNREEHIDAAIVALREIAEG